MTTWCSHASVALQDTEAQTNLQVVWRLLSPLKLSFVLLSLAASCIPVTLDFFWTILFSP